MKNLKTITILTLAIMLLMPTINVNAYTLVTENKIDIMVDGVIYPQEASMGECHFDSNGRTQIPIRWLAGITNSNFEWDPETNRIVITKGDRTVEFTINSYMYKDNGFEKEMDSYAYVRTPEYRTYLPIRFATEPLGYKVDYIRNQGQVKESKRDHIVKLTYIGEVEGEKEAENDSSSNNVKGINLKSDFSKSKELQALKEKASLEFSEGYIGANFNPERSWIPPFMFSSNEEYGYYDFLMPYDPVNEQGYLEVLKYALRYSVEKGDYIYNKFEEAFNLGYDRTVSKEDWEKYKAENCRKFIKVADNVYYNIYFSQGGQLQLIVSQKPVW